MIFLHHYQREDNIKTFSRKKLLENLAYYLHKDQNDITLNFNENGKPMADGVYFSISHCGKNAVQVFCKNTEVGHSCGAMALSNGMVTPVHRRCQANERSWC